MTEAPTGLNLDGITIALITPWSESGTIDWEALERIVQRACTAGVVAVSPAGTTGEGPRLSLRQRLELVHRCAEVAPEAVPVISGVVTASLDETLHELDLHAEAGADAALVTPPVRMPLGAEGCRSFFTHVADRSPLPLILYHIPALTGVPVPAEVVTELAAHPAIVGLKDSNADIQYHLGVAASMDEARLNNFSLLTGTDAMLTASGQAGGTGAIIASANLVPAWSVAVHRSIRAGAIDAALEVQQRLHRVVLACRRGSGPAGWKAAMEIAGLCSGRPVPPGEALSAPQMTALRAELEELGALL